VAKKRAVITGHARSRLERDKTYSVSEQTLVDIVTGPDEVVRGEGNRMIAHRVLDEDYILRVVYEESESEIQIITFYRAKKKRYYRGGSR
jgi:hypothetical protein